MSDKAAAEPHESNLSIHHAGGTRLVHFPDTGNMRESLAGVLTGKEYPLVMHPEYVPDVIVDVGANVGGSTLFFALNYPTARVLAYEPSPGNAEYLRRNTRDLPRVEAFAYGLSDRAETVKLYHGKAQAMQSSVFHNGESAEGHEAAELRKTSDEFAARGLDRVSILKVDTEGCELRILNDLGSRLAAVDLLYVEYHSDDDRRRIDALLSEYFVLHYAQARNVHRGTVLYLARPMLRRFPPLDAMRIDSTRRVAP